MISEVIKLINLLEFAYYLKRILETILKDLPEGQLPHKELS